jgi:hypothetical protein
MLRHDRLTAATLLALALSAAAVSSAGAEPSFFNSRCATSGCHTNDSATCDGCHQHRGNLSASANLSQYAPGDPVTITLHGGQEGGWVRGILYNELNQEIARRSGPSGSGDDNQSGDVTFPVTFHVTAPAVAGNYTWQAAWYGNPNNSGSTHSETRTPVVIHVVGSTAGAPEVPPGFIERTWGKIKDSFRR